MFFSSRACASLAAVGAIFAVFAPSVLAAGSAQYDYDPASSVGPPLWGDVNVPNNECYGDRNSPVDIDTDDSCHDFSDYSLSVSATLQS